MYMLFKRINNCRLCGENKLIDFFDLGEHSLSGCFPGPKVPDPQMAPLVLSKCDNCNLVQLGHDTDLSEMFTYEYGYRSSLNASMKTHLSELVKWVKNIRPVKPNETVLDIGANDGTLLSNYSPDKVTRIAIDPIIGKFKNDYPNDIQCYEGFFNLENTKNFLKDRKVQLITSISMFYDLPDPSDFVAGIEHILASDGIWVLEQSYLVLMLERNAFDTICHEHLEYYAYSQIERLVTNAGLRIINVELNECNGGSFRIAVAREESNFSSNEENINAIKEKEARLGLGTSKPYDQFLQRIDHLKTQLNSFLQKASDDNKTVYLYGASTKGNTLLQHYGIDNKKVTAALEVNPEKFGHRTPGTNIPIIDEKSVLNDVPDYLLVLPWHFKDNILSNSHHFLEKGSKFIFPLPELAIVGIEDL